MLELRFGAGVAEWVAARIPHVGTAAGFGDCAAIGFARDGELIAGAVFSNHRGHDIELSFAAADPRWARRGNLRAVFHYPFRQLGCARVTVVTGRNNARARRLAAGLGFTLEGIVRRGLDGREDAFVFGMLREECRWLSTTEDSHGKIVTVAAARA